MKTKFMQCLAALALLLSANAAQAAISCSISSPGFIAGYTSGGAQVITQVSYSITCTRGLTTDPTTTAYSVKVGNGLNPAGGGKKQAAFGANRLRYDTYIDSGCATQWRGATTIPSVPGTITMVGLTPTTVIQNFWGCIAALLTPVAGTYTDTVTLTPTYSAGVSGGSNTFPVTIITPATCTIATIPNITLAYTAFRLTAATATTSAPVTCSNNLPYTMAVSPTSGVSAGINYSLSLPASGTGNGVSQGITITATAPAGQAGTCATGACTGVAQAHTLTVTY